LGLVYSLRFIPPDRNLVVRKQTVSKLLRPLMTWKVLVWTPLDEWPHILKTGIVERLSWVRIPPPPQSRVQAPPAWAGEEQSDHAARVEQGHFLLAERIGAVHPEGGGQHRDQDEAGCGAGEKRSLNDGMSPHIAEKNKHGKPKRRCPNCLAKDSVHRERATQRKEGAPLTPLLPANTGSKLEYLRSLHRRVLACKNLKEVHVLFAREIEALAGKAAA
jgi:hypothetical protein